MRRKSLIAAALVIVIGCGRSVTPPGGSADIEAALSDYRVVQFSPGDATQTRGPKIIQVFQDWADTRQIRNEDAEGRVGYSYAPQITMSVNVAGDWKAVTELIRGALESSSVTPEELLRNPDDRVRLATYYALGQSEPIPDRFPNSSRQIIAELAQTASGKNVYEAAQALSLLGASGVFNMEAFVGAVEHPCTQIRLAALSYSGSATLTDEETTRLLPRLVECLADRDRVVREAAYSRVSIIIQQWRAFAQSGGKLPEDIRALIETVPRSPENWYRDLSRPTAKSLATNKAEWKAWLAPEFPDEPKKGGSAFR